VTKTSVVDKCQLSIRAATAATIASAIAQAMQRGQPAVVLVGAVIVTDLSPARTRSLATRRIAGSVVGAVVGAAVRSVLPAGPFAIGCGVLVAMLTAHFLDLDAASPLAGYVGGIVVMSNTDAVWSYALNRVIDTCLGLGVAVLVSYLPKLLRSDSAG
jgi:uncharacterized membrane protein YgaE (UPF0421/DUF939 family)